MATSNEESWRIWTHKKDHTVEYEVMRVGIGYLVRVPGEDQVTFWQPNELEHTYEAKERNGKDTS